MDDIEFRKLYDSCSKYCMNSLLRWTKNKQDAEDAFAEAISIYWIRYKQGKVKNQDNIKAYVLRIALNLYRNKLKAENRMVDRALFDVEPISFYLPEPFQEKSVASKLLSAAFKKISIDCQKMLTAKYVYGYKYEEIAEDMGRKSGNSVKVQTFRCAQYLLKMINSLREEEPNKFRQDE